MSEPKLQAGLWGISYYQPLPNPYQSLIARLQILGQLQVADLREQRAHPRPGLHSERFQVIARLQRRDDLRLLLQLLRLRH